MLKDMSKKKMRGFTLIELIAVLVIMAILALIVTPLVMNIIRKARIAADKRSVDAYGRSIELAIASYLLDNGKFPTSVGELTIEYSGNKVACSTTQLNPDSSVYLAGCTVAGRTVDYAYGKYEAPSYTAYSVGDHISYNGVTYYVIEDSDTTKDTVKLLKDTSLSYIEMTSLGVTDVTITNYGSIGYVQYGSSTDYSTSIVKQLVDKWAEGAVKAGDTATARLITKDELVNNMGYVFGYKATSYNISAENTPSWVYSPAMYWTMSEYESPLVWTVNNGGKLTGNMVSDSFNVRPVLEIPKTAELNKLDS